jgi:hypothetical protein
MDTIDPLETERSGIKSDDSLSPLRDGYPRESNLGTAIVLALPLPLDPDIHSSLEGESPDNSIHLPFPLVFDASPFAFFFDLPLSRYAAGEGYRDGSLWKVDEPASSGFRGELRDRSLVGETTDRFAGDRPDAETTTALSAKSLFWR